MSWDRGYIGALYVLRWGISFRDLALIIETAGLCLHIMRWTFT